MKEFEVTITETLERIVTVEASSQDEARQMVEDMWRNSDIILTDSDFTDVDYDVNDGKEIDRSNEIEVLIVKPGEYAKVATIENTLSVFKNIVGGYIETASYFDDPVTIICNEEGKIDGSELNRAIRDDTGKIIDTISGAFVVCGVNGSEFVSLTDDMRNKYGKMFKNPEAFLKMGKGIMAIPCEPKPQKENKGQDNKSKGQEL